MGFFSPIFGKGKPLSWLGKEKERDRDPSPPPASLQAVAGSDPASSSAPAAPKASVASGTAPPLAPFVQHAATPAAASTQATDSNVMLQPAIQESSLGSSLPLADKCTDGNIAPTKAEVAPGPTAWLGGEASLISPPQLILNEAYPEEVMPGAAAGALQQEGLEVGIPPSGAGIKADHDSASKAHVQADGADELHALQSPSASSTRKSDASKGTASRRVSYLGQVCTPLHADTSGSMAGSDDAASFGGASGDASGVQSGSAWGLEETARSTVSLPVTALHRRARGRGKSKASLLYDEVSVQEADEEGEEDEEDAFSTGQVLDFWAGKRRGTAGRDAMTDSGTTGLRRAVSSAGRRGDSSMSPHSTSQCHPDQVHLHENESDWDRTSSSQVYHQRLPRAASTDSHAQHQAVTVWETMTGHLESMRQKQQMQQQSPEDWEAGQVPGGNISPRTEPAPNEQHISGEGVLDGDGSGVKQGTRASKAWEVDEEGGGSGAHPSALDAFKEKFGPGVERQDAASCADIETPAHADTDYGGSNRGSDGEENEDRDHDGIADDAASGGKLSAMTGMSDTALLHLLLQQEKREGEEDEDSSVGDASSDDALSHVPLRNGHVAVSALGLNLRKSATSTSTAVPAGDGLGGEEEREDGTGGERVEEDHPDADYEEEEEEDYDEDAHLQQGAAERRRWAGIFDGLADGGGQEMEGEEEDAFGYGDAEARLREMLGGGDDDNCVMEEGPEEIQTASGQHSAVATEGAVGVKGGEGQSGAAPMTEEAKLLALQAAALEYMKSGDVQKKAAQAQALMALRPDMARVAQWLTAVEPAEAPPDHLWFNISDAKEDPLVKDKQKPAPPPKASAHVHKKPPVAGAPGQSGSAVSPQLAGAMEAAARLLASKDKHLQALYLSAHGLQVVPPSLPAFSHLKTLDLSRNSIANMPSGLLPPSLHILDVSHNRLAAIEGLRDLGRLRLLNLSHNRITRIGHGLVGCTSLRELYLASNKVGEVEGLHRLLKLQVLDLSANKVTSTRAVSQLAANEGSLKALNLLSNPIHVNLGNDAFKRFVTGLLPHLQVLNQRPVKATGSSRDLIADSHTSSKGLSRSGHHSKHVSTRDPRGKASNLITRRHGSVSAFPGPSSTTGSSVRHSKSGTHGVGSSRSRHHKSKDSSRVSGTRHHGSRLQPMVIPAGVDEHTLQQMLVLQQQQQYLLLQQQQMGVPLAGHPAGAPVGVIGPNAGVPVAGSSEHLALLEANKNLSAG